MRRISRGLAGVVGVMLLGVIATGGIHEPRSVAATHKWLSHGLLILAWTSVLLGIGVTLSRLRSRPFATAAQVLLFLLLLAVLLGTSFTGYLGPSSGPTDEMTLRRFQVLHYWVFPTLATALVVWWYSHLRTIRKAPLSGDVG